MWVRLPDVPGTGTLPPTTPEAETREVEMRRYEQDLAPAGAAFTLPIFFGVWLVCAVIAGLVWQNLVDNTLAQIPLSLSFSALLVLSAGFGMAGAGLVSLAVDIVRRP